MEPNLLITALLKFSSSSGKVFTGIVPIIRVGTSRILALAIRFRVQGSGSLFENGREADDVEDGKKS